MVRGLLFALASSGCSLVLDFSDKAIPKDAALDAPDAPYDDAECTYMEPNDTFATAMMVTTTDTGPAAICPGSTEDHDFYKFTVPAGTTSVVVTVTFSEAIGDLDLRLYDSTATVIAQSRGFTDMEQITCPGTSPPCAALTAGDYAFEVFPAVTGATNFYNFSLALTPSP
jgi:hypothetical protein